MSGIDRRLSSPKHVAHDEHQAGPESFAPTRRRLSMPEYSALADVAIRLLHWLAHVEDAGQHPAVVSGQPGVIGVLRIHLHGTVTAQ